MRMTTLTTIISRQSAFSGAKTQENMYLILSIPKNIRSAKQTCFSFFSPLSSKVLFKDQPVHRGVFCQFPLWWIYYYDSNEFTGKETGKTYLCEKCFSIWSSRQLIHSKPFKSKKVEYWFIIKNNYYLTARETWHFIS